jgi:site-specific DNA recombinase
MKKAVIYTRVSTEEQAKHDLSLPFQKDKCNEYAKKNGYTVVEEFEDAGKSVDELQRIVGKLAVENEILKKALESLD